MNRLETDFSKSGMFSNLRYLKYLQYEKKSYIIYLSLLSQSRFWINQALVEHVNDEPVTLSFQFLFR